MSMTSEDVGPTRTLAGAWGVVGLLWGCGFLNYADRQAVFSVFDLLGREFDLDGAAKGMIGTSFMVVYALAAPLTGFLVDRHSRRRLIVAGLAVWSAVCAATGLAGSFHQLLAFRAAEGLGESFYFPASMSLLADVHGGRTRSRAMSLHQTSVYAGTAFGGVLAGYLGQRYGWRAPFAVLGTLGVAYALLLPRLLHEPQRTAKVTPADAPGLLAGLGSILRTPAAVALLLAFAGANFVAMTLLSWLPDFVKQHYPQLDLTASAVVAAVYLPAANMVGALGSGYVADRIGASRRGGRALVQAFGLLLGAPCVFVAGRTDSLPVLIGALIAIGLCKGVYDANIFASLFDVVRPEIRGTAAGLMNTVGWGGASLAPVLIGLAGDAYGLDQAIAATAAVYLVAAAFAATAAVLARKHPLAIDNPENR